MKWIATQYGVTLNASFIEKIEVLEEENGQACLFAYMNEETYIVEVGHIDLVLKAYGTLMNYLEGSEEEK